MKIKTEEVISERIVEIKIEFPTNPLFILNFSEITKVVTATGIEASSAKTLKSLFSKK